ncbi:MAG: metallophosphoesterase family protein [Treponema sp.]|jgi:Icc-related predicted phosphoesterase|nr:metallophosphoesterase family protein [Treponema sp.]
MKILCISDQIDPLVYTNTVRERFKDVDLILSAGDLPMDYLDFIISSLNKPLLFVFGNHHTEDMPYYTGGGLYSVPGNSVAEHYHGSGAIHVGSRICREEGLIIAGLGGSMRYNRGNNQFTEFQMKKEILKLIPGLIFNRIFRGRYLDILLTHASPRGIHDREDRCHLGFKCFLWFMRKFKPRYLIHGHIHLYDLRDIRVTKYRETTVINAYSHYIFNTGEGK